MITLYDIPSKLPNKAWSPNVWRTRFLLNYKGIPYQTEWIEYPDIEPLSKKIGVKPTAQRKDGTDYYSVPLIVDSTTGAVIADSWKIALYLEKTFPAPEYPRLFPPNTYVAQYAFHKAFWQFFPDALDDLVIPDTAALLNEGSQAYFAKKIVKEYGYPLEEISPLGTKREEVWAAAKRGLDVLSEVFDRNGAESTFVMGDTLTYADFIMAGCFVWDKLVLSKGEWEVFQSLNGGRWGRFMKTFEAYETVA